MNKEDITFDPSSDEVLGVFNDYVHVKTYEAVLLITRDEYIRVWNNWLDGKQAMCKFYDHYCGVMGYTCPKKIEESPETVILNENMVPVEYPIYIVEQFENYHDFEHGKGSPKNSYD